jgi:hypothetical protein
MPRTFQVGKDKPIKIPDAWLMGCSQMREKEGLDPRAAIVECIRRWKEQERLGEEYERQHSND